MPGRAPAAAQQAADAPVIVIPFDNPTQAARLAWMREGAAILLTDVLAAAGAPVIEREERLQAFDRLQLPTYATLSRASTIRVGEALGGVGRGERHDADGRRPAHGARAGREARQRPPASGSGGHRTARRSVQRVRAPGAADSQHARAAGADQRSIPAIASGFRAVREGARRRNAIHRARVSRAGAESGAAVRSRACGVVGSPLGSRRASARARRGVGHRQGQHAVSRGQVSPRALADGSQAA